MSMPYPPHNVYAHLYARYLIGNRTEQLLAAAGPLEGKVVADLCAGGGRLSKLALALGAKVTAVDESAAMLEGVGPEIDACVRSVDSWLTSFCGSNEFDAIFCQQAVNYWLTPELAKQLGDVVRPGGVFVFNTFNKAPSRAPTLKQYELDGVKFIEASWLSGESMVEHVQMREGAPPHTTRFRWITPAQYRAWLSPYFELDERIDGGASVWVCTKRPMG